MSRLIIQGGRPLHGVHTPSGNKNAALPMLAAAILTDRPVVLDNVPRIEDVGTMLALLAGLGVSVERDGHRVTLCAAGLRDTVLDAELGRRVRSSILFAGPLAARHGSAELAPPGGDVIGRRRLDAHFRGLAALGIEHEAGTRYRLTRRGLQAADILLDEASVTATENILMAAVLVPGRTTIYNAACEPHVQDLGHLLNRMGAKITGIGTNRLIVEGVERLDGAAYTVQADHVEVGSYLAAAAATGGRIEIRDADASAMAVIGPALRRLGLAWTESDGHLVFEGGGELCVEDDMEQALPTISDGVWPAFPSDLMSVAIVVATQARGTALFFEKLFESRMYFVDRLIDMGARIVQCDPHRVVVAGPSRLRGTPLSSPDIRAGMALLVAALCAEGESVIGNVESIDRGYERIEENLRRLGAEVVRVTGQ